MAWLCVRRWSSSQRGTGKRLGNPQAFRKELEAEAPISQPAWREAAIRGGGWTSAGNLVRLARTCAGCCGSLRIGLLLRSKGRPGPNPRFLPGSANIPCWIRTSNRLLRRQQCKAKTACCYWVSVLPCSLLRENRVKLGQAPGSRSLALEHKKARHQSRQRAGGGHIDNQRWHSIARRLVGRWWFNP
jgi:hypothetical protein